MKQVDNQIEQLAVLMNKDIVHQVTKETVLKVGVDLGTSSIVLVVLDQDNEPIFGAFEYADTVRDGLVVNYRESVEIVKRLKARAESCLGRTLEAAAGAVPPGTIGNSKQIVANVIESADMIATAIIDEPTAAASVLGVTTGAVIDVGGGTTGISIFRNGQVVFTADEPTGGTHMTLVLAGYYQISIAEAEKEKRLIVNAKSNAIIMKPVVEKMAEITRGFLAQSPSKEIYLVGGATTGEDFHVMFENYLQRVVLHPAHPEFVTPFGIAMNA